MDSIAAPTASTPAPTGRPGGIVRKLFGDDGMSFKDVLDLVNPLQHIPVVGYVYRKLTGDELAPAVRVAGGALFGGPLGAALSVAGLVLERGNAAASDDESPGAVAPEAIAGAAPAEAPRGGWMIAAATTGALPPFVPLSPAAPAPAAFAVAQPAAQPRGGWMLSAAQATPLRASTAADAAVVDARTGVPDASPAPDIAMRLQAERAFSMTLALADPATAARRLRALA